MYQISQASEMIAAGAMIDNQCHPIGAVAGGKVGCIAEAVGSSRIQVIRGLCGRF
jgi:hypothetical protein